MGNPTDEIWENDWGSEGATPPQDDNDGWNDWTSSSQDDDLQDFNDMSSSGGFIDQTVQGDQTYYQADDSFRGGDIIETAPRTNFSMKTVSFMLAGAFIVLALIFMFIDNVHINKKPTPSTQVQQQAPQQTGNTQQSGGSSSSSLNSVTLVEIPSSTQMTYGTDVLKANGKVTNKHSYVLDNQIIYNIEITIAVGSSSQVVNYYCAKNTFDMVKVNDLLIVNYVQVDDTYISVTNVEK